jgi:hypothetical protein
VIDQFSLQPSASYFHNEAKERYFNADYDAIMTNLQSRIEAAKEEVRNTSIE